MQFDWTITFGNIMSTLGPIIGFIGAGLLFINKISMKVMLIDHRLIAAENNLKEAATGIRQLVSDNASIALLAEKQKFTDLKIDTDLIHRIKNVEMKMLGMELLVEKRVARKRGGGRDRPAS